MFISRIDASRIACNLSHKEIRKLSNCPKMNAVECKKWRRGLTSYIESVYTGEAATLSDIAAEFSGNINRRFRTESGEAIDFCKVLDNYLMFMCLPQNNGKKYTLKRFNSFIARYTEI